MSVIDDIIKGASGLLRPNRAERKKTLLREARKGRRRLQKPARMRAQAQREKAGEKNLTGRKYKQPNSRTKKVGRVAAKVTARTGLTGKAARKKARRIIRKRSS